MHISVHFNLNCSSSVRAVSMVKSLVQLHHWYITLHISMQPKILPWELHELD